MLHPSDSALYTANTRLSVGLASAEPSSDELQPEKASSALSPGAPMPVMRKAFCRASSNDLPIDITSPTDFISLPISRSTSLNLPRSQRGTLTTQ